MRTPRPALAALGLLAVAFLSSGGTALGGVRDDAELNYEIHVPDDWTWLDVGPFAEHKVVVGADRKLATLADGKPAEGQGGRVLLSVQEPPKDFPTEEYEGWLFDWQQLELQAKEKDPVPDEMIKQIDDLRAKMEKALAGLAARPEVQELLLQRFGKNRPAAEVDDRGVTIATLPAAKVSAPGTCANHAGVVAKCDASMFVWVVRKRMYRLALWIWPTEHDREHLRDQRDEIELSMDVPKKEAFLKKGPPPKPDEPANGGGPGPGGKGERLTLRDLAMGFEAVKPPRLMSEEIDRSQATERDVAFRFQAENQGDSVTMEMFSFRIGTAGATGFDLQQYFSGIWSSFIKLHAAGAITTSPFAPVTPRNPFLTLPDFAKKKDLKRPDDPAEKLSVSDLERMGVLTEVKKPSVGKVKVDHAWRLMLKGNIERIGDDWWVIYTFSTDSRTYVVRLTVRKGGWDTWKDDVIEALRSISLLEEK
jgi:hypothetical protein